MRLVAFLVLLTACGSGRASAPDTEAVDDTVPPAAVAPDTTYPRPRRGALIARSAFPGPLSGEWQPTAGVCGGLHTLQLLARGDTVDVLVVLQLPAESPATGAYVVRDPEDSTAGPRTARIGVQRVQYADLAYRSERGSVELNRLDRLASGRFDVVLREVTSQDTVRYLGVFERIRVDSLPEPACRAAARDLPPGVH